jgi:hypothetical protein
MGNTKNSTQIMQNENYTLQLIKGYDPMRQPFYAFALFNLSRWDEIQGNIGKDGVNLDKECIVLLRGIGHNVPETAEQQALYLFQTEYLRKN